MPFLDFAKVISSGLTSAIEQDSRNAGPLESIVCQERSAA